VTRKIKIKFECIACKNKTPISCKKPTYGKNTVANFDCENCDSEYLLSIQKCKGGGPNAFQYAVIEGVISDTGFAAAQKIADEIKARTPAIDPKSIRGTTINL